MPWLEQTRNGYYQVAFRFSGERFKKALHTQNERTATARLHRLDENIRLVERGRLIVPDDADICTFLLSDGQLNGKKCNRPKRTLGI